MINAVIIDDEQHCINRLGSLLREHCADTVTLAGTWSSVPEGLEALRRQQPDLVFLDVMIHEETGFDLLKQLPRIHFDVIFTTAFEKYAVQAFKFSAIDYLLKPIDPDDLKQAIGKMVRKMEKSELPGKLETLFHNLKDMQGSSKRIGIPTINGFTFLQVNDIIHCQSDINYTTLFLKEKQKITVAKTLKEFEELLSEYNFYRVHNSHLINLGCVKSYNKGKGGFVLMSDNSEIEVSTRRKDEFLKKLLS
ncbi:MAG TPA: LytTR family DNA-binding domain-containing protein [Chitinophagaceae bacterium]|jgi:two-component system LytT family response regulator